MRGRPGRSVPSNGPPLPPALAKCAAIIALFVFAACISSACTSEIDNDLVFDDEYQTLNGHQSHISSHQSNVNQPSDNVNLFKKLTRPIRAALPGLFDWLTEETSTSISSTEETDDRTRRDTDEVSVLTSPVSGKRSTRPARSSRKVKKDTTDEGAYDRADTDETLNNEIEDDEEEIEETDSSDYSSGSSPSSSSTSEATSDPVGTERRYLRLSIGFFEPYFEDLSSKKNSRHQEIVDQLTTAIHNILKTPDFANLTVIAIMNTNVTGISKAIIDLEIFGDDTKSMEIKDTLLQKLVETDNKLGSVMIVPSRLEVVDNLDYRPVSCPDDYFPCSSPLLCFRKQYRCDKLTNCLDKFDEKDCPGIPEKTIANITGCTRGSDPFICPEGVNIVCESDKCNGVEDCYYGEDELNCPCSGDQFKCDLRCHPMSIKCNGIKDCADGLDEVDCPTTTSSTTTTTTTTTTRKPTTTSTTTRKPTTTSTTTRKPTTTSTTTTTTPSTTSSTTTTSTTTTSTTTTPTTTTTEPSTPSTPTTTTTRRKIPTTMTTTTTTTTKPPPSPPSPTTSTPITSVVCPEGEYLCYDFKTCYSLDNRCDNNTDCPGGEDEMLCPTDNPITPSTTPPPPSPCPPNTFQCGDGICIDNSQVCDGKPDCTDYTDESNTRCNFCGDNMFQCTNRQCIQRTHWCDGVRDCADGSDEPSTCPTSKCLPTEFQCESKHRCIHQMRQCDGFEDCRDGSDERNCTKCLPTEFQCASKRRCIHKFRQCDGFDDCRDGSDERNCTESTTTTDTPGYLNLKAYPTFQVVKEGQQVVFLCRDEGLLRSRITWERGFGQPLPQGFRVNETEGRLEIDNIQLNEGGTYICRALQATGVSGSNQISVSLRVDPWPRPVTPKPPCDVGQATCRNGDCIPKSDICNGRPDCADGSDERDCREKYTNGTLHACEPNEFSCANQRCIKKTWVCDAEDDCGDRSDESNCGPSIPGYPCRSDEFNCTNSQCIPKAYHCDYNRDCEDGSDEVGCSIVSIIENPPRNVTLREGETFYITCRTYGIPTPEVIWRFNWGHVPAKCRTTSVNGFGTLTCPGIAIEDAGAYSCEGINSHGSTFAIDTILVVEHLGPGPGSICQPPYFNNLARTPSECLPCFCFGASKVCSSANLFIYQIPPPLVPRRILNVVYDSARSNLEILSGEINPLESSIRSSSNSFQIQGYIDESLPGENKYPYFPLPENYLGNQLKSYGGYIKYQLRYQGSGPQVDSPDIIISGNGYNLVHINAIHGPGIENEQTVRFIYGSWFKLRPFESPIPATREEIMMTLAKLDQILLKIQFYPSRFIDTVISNLYVDSAAAGNTGLGQAALVEECSCPPGYTGLSCEECASGYERNRTNEPYLGKCVKSEIRLPCPNKTYEEGEQCLPCPCSPVVQECPRDVYGRITCRCPSAGYVGPQCDRCAPGYSGSPYIPAGCQPSLCNEAGSTSLVPNPATGVCSCKQNTYGNDCSQCSPNTFHLSSSNVFGCIQCFCMGLTSSCVSSHLYRSQIISVFYRDTQDFKIGARSEVESNPKTEVRIDPYQQEIMYSSFSSDTSNVYYWTLPQKFLGNKITSYGGYLTYTIQYVPASSSQSRSSACDVEIISEINSIHLFYFHPEPVEPNRLQVIRVPILEQYWQRNDGQIANREHLLMALANVKAILVKASYSTYTQTAGLQNVTLDIAEERFNGQNRALEVEECRCPPGYRGSSCEECDAGYHRADFGLYLGTCEPCQCNGHSRDCDSSTGACVNCADHTTGDHCELCEAGYTGDPTTGSCSRLNEPCNCDPRGSLSNECRNGVCSCKINVEGEHCGTCRFGTFDLQSYHTEGCLSCYCSGVTTDCQSSNFFTTTIPMQFFTNDSSNGFALTSASEDRMIKAGLKFDIGSNQIVYDYTAERGQDLFWSLPSTFTGHKITSYGGRLSWSQGSIAPYNAFPRNQGSDLVIRGDGISLYWDDNTLIPQDKLTARSLILVETSFRRVLPSGTQMATRQDLLRVLSKVESILIRASHYSQTSSVFISDVSMDTAVSQQLSTIRATHIENCRCPAEYKGLSCERCAHGFYQLSTADGYVKECRKCPCNDNEESCSYDSSLGTVICNCRPEFAGRYCEGSGTVTPPTSTYFPIPPPTPPTPTIIVNISEPYIYIIAAGNTLRLTCTAQSLISRPITVSWSKVGETLDRQRFYEDGNGHLVVVNALVSDTGTYICSASDRESIITSNISVTVQDASVPRISITPETSSGTLSFIAGNLIIVNCDASGVPPPNVEWIRENGTPIGKTAAPGRNILRLQGATVSDSGSYICRARNLIGSDSRRIYINVQARGDTPDEPTDYPPDDNIRLSVTPPDFRGTAGETVRMDCVILSDPGGYRLSWSRAGGAPMPVGTDDRDGRLVILRADASDSGQYLCKAFNERTGQFAAETSARLVIEERGQPVITIDPPEKLTVAQGSLAVMRCSSSDPTAPVRWRRAYENFTETVQIIDNELRIPAAQVRDRGVYVCEASNSAGSGMASVALEVERREAPQISIYPESTQMIEEGGSAYLQCRTLRGIPTPRIRWMRRGPQQFSPNVNETNGVLSFVGVTREDAGEYICIAENNAGSVEAVANIEIISSPSIHINPPGPLTVYVGQSVRFECRASGQPLPVVEWQTSGSYRILPASVEGTPGSAILYINSAQLYDSNTYVCSASNVAGRVEEQVQLNVLDNGPVLPPTPGSSLSPDKENAVPRGSNTQLRCDVRGFTNEVFIHWRRESDIPLRPPHAIESDFILNIYNIDESDAGKYMCTGISKTTGQTLFTQSLTLRVLIPPEIKLDPTRQVVRPGDSPSINCSATGVQPIEIYWSPINGASLPRSATFDRGLLQFRSININDAGRYLCRARNYAGEAEAVAEVVVNDFAVPPTIIKAESPFKMALENDNLDLRCFVNSSIPYQMRWTRDRGDLPESSQTFGDTLRFYRLKLEDSGQYRCHIMTPYGPSEAYITLHVERINNVTLSIIPTKREVKVGDSVDLMCHVEGDDRSSFSWIKVGGVLEPNVLMHGNTIRIRNVQLSNVGTYRCSILTKDGYRSIDYDLNIELPATASSITAVGEKIANYGQNIDLICESNLQPPVNYSWVVHSLEKSLRRVVPNAQNLTIQNLNANHSGLYFCNLAKDGIFVIQPQALIIDNVIPSFGGSSHITLPPLTQAAEAFDIEINFKPTNYDGLLLFSSASKDIKTDFFSLSLQNGNPVFKFNVGSGPAIIKGDIPLQINRWHRIRLTRHFRNGTMEVDGIKFNGMSRGSFETLDLQLPLYVGGHPDYSFIQLVADINVGFQGCINGLRIDSREVNLREDAIESVGLLNCHNCAINPCKNNGYCQESSSSNGYTCICIPGYSGEHCEVRKTTCYLDSCGSGQCLENDNGIECLCPFGKGGKQCRDDIKIHVPAFTKNSYMAYLTPLLSEKMKLSLKVKPFGNNTIENGLVLFIAKGENGADFISLYILENYMHLQFRIKGQVINLRSNRYLVPGEYVTVSLTLDSTQVQFGVANESLIAEEFNPTNEIHDFKWQSTLYVGGYDKKSTVLPEDLPVKTGFHGCISSIEILGIDTSILQSYSEAVNINDCFSQFGDTCEALKPCRNGGSCSTTRDTYRCDCLTGYSGTDCERRLDACELQRPCKNGGTCISTGDGYKCSCPLGFVGVHCGSEVALGYNIAFHGDGYIELNELTNIGYNSVETIDISFMTKYSNGLLLWRGRNDEQSEYFAIAVRNGYVQLAFHTSRSSPLVLKATNHRVDDNTMHRVYIQYSQQGASGKISMNLDNQTEDVIDSEVPFDARGNIFAGGLPNFRATSNNLYSEGFEGCIRNLRINNLPINFGEAHAVSGVNAATCTGISDKSGGSTTVGSAQNGSSSATDLHQVHPVHNSTTSSQHKDKPSVWDQFANVNLNSSGQIYSKNYFLFRNASYSPLREVSCERLLVVFLASVLPLKMLIVYL